ncbi:cysteine-rich and transmembrane domain-containing protein WIH2-like [Cynara cardunculus var. scolymus]|uniref:cysteine-rich and transmembrane domain-containing protein WIH2-like n=1 Tax=Cynara cardunculus var. scolymus TaxID=59895 RepID=UPI000D6252BA|nr:cysteine-rich and transmembrane domain-containing protein WIH2-like [Cynara cardunculus var. scolymus]
MSNYGQNQPSQVLDYPIAQVEGGTDRDYVAPHPVPPPAVGSPVKDGQNPPPHGTQSRGDGFWRGCCAGMCCCCLLDICF